MNSIYLRLVDYRSGTLTANGTFDGNVAPIKESFDAKTAHFIQVARYSSGIEQTLNIGSQSTGAGAGRATFNPFTIQRSADVLSPLLFQNAASGTPFKTADVLFVNAQNLISLRHTYKLVAVKTISWSAESSEADPVETVTFEYGGLIVTVNQQAPDGKLLKMAQGGWNRVRNIVDTDLNTAIQ